MVLESLILQGLRIIFQKIFSGLLLDQYLFGPSEDSYFLLTYLGQIPNFSNLLSQFYFYLRDFSPINLALYFHHVVTFLCSWFAQGGTSTQL